MQQPGLVRGITGIRIEPIPGRAVKLRRRRHHALGPGTA